MVVESRERRSRRRGRRNIEEKEKEEEKEEEKELKKKIRRAGKCRVSLQVQALTLASLPLPTEDTVPGSCALMHLAITLRRSYSVRGPSMRLLSQDHLPNTGYPPHTNLAHKNL